MARHYLVHDVSGLPPFAPRPTNRLPRPVCLLRAAHSLGYLLGMVPQHLGCVGKLHGMFAHRLRQVTLLHSRDAASYGGLHTTGGLGCQITGHLSRGADEADAPVEKVNDHSYTGTGQTTYNKSLPNIPHVSDVLTFWGGAMVQGATDLTLEYALRQGGPIASELLFRGSECWLAGLGRLRSGKETSTVSARPALRHGEEEEPHGYGYVMSLSASGSPSWCRRFGAAALVRRPRSACFKAPVARQGLGAMVIQQDTYAIDEPGN